MKEIITTYTCDNCSKQVKLQNGNYPFDMGWFRLDGIVLKIPSEIRTVVEESNLDFCKLSCMFEKINKEVVRKGVRENIKEQEHMQKPQTPQVPKDDFRVETILSESEPNFDDIIDRQEIPQKDDRRRRMF